CPKRSPVEVGARAGRRGALLRSCPPASPCGRPLLLYFAAQSAPPARPGHAAAVFDDGTPPPSPHKDVGGPTERSKGGGGGRQADAGGHERSRPPNVLGCRATRQGMTAQGRKLNSPTSGLSAARPTAASRQSGTCRRRRAGRTRSMRCAAS